MKLTRGQFVGLATATVGGLGLSGCGEAIRHLSAPELPENLGATDIAASDPVWRVLNRAAFGPRPGDVERVRQMGVNAYIEEQLAPERIEESRAGWMRLLPLDTLEMDAGSAEDYETAVFPEVGKGDAALDLQKACVLRAVYSSRQLQEVMVEFWTDHFNISQLKAECSWLKTVDDRLIRKHALGNFRDLVSASAHSPAMLFYLDNEKNQKKDEKSGSGPNENYARELLELHTLGIHGGYTLKDIQEVARCFSGWAYAKNRTLQPGEFQFQKEHHDDGVKHVLGRMIPGGQGKRDGEQVLDIVCGHPSTARFIARKLCRRFIADKGPEPLVRKLADTFLKSGGNIRQVLSVLLHSEEFLHGSGRKFKRPFDFTVSALRALNADTDATGVLPHLERMGQLPFKWAMPDGYPDRFEAWTPSLLARWNFAVDLVENRIKGTTVEANALAKATERTDTVGICAALSRLALGTALPVKQLDTLAALANGAAYPGEGAIRQWLALFVSTPQFQWR